MTRRAGDIIAGEYTPNAAPEIGSDAWLALNPHGEEIDAYEHGEPIGRWAGSSYAEDVMPCGCCSGSCYCDGDAS